MTIDYETLLKDERTLLNEFSLKQVTYETQFRFTELNEVCNKCMLDDQYDSNTLLSKSEFENKLPALQIECKKCKEYYINKRSKCVKKLDVEYGKDIENILIDYLGKHGITAVLTSTLNDDLRYPDVAIIDKTNTVVAYLEVKYHAAPFIAAEKMVGIPCYSSISLDYTKIKNQLELIKNNIVVPVYYVHWIDFPCIKGIWFEDSETVEKIMNKNGCEFIRKDKEGDYTLKKSSVRKCGHTDKFYVNPAKLEPFEILMNNLDKLVNVQYAVPQTEIPEEEKEKFRLVNIDDNQVGVQDEKAVSPIPYRYTSKETPFCKFMYDGGLCGLDLGMKCTCNVSINFDRKSYILQKPEWCKNKVEE